MSSGLAGALKRLDPLVISDGDWHAIASPLARHRLVDRLAADPVERQQVLQQLAQYYSARPDAEAWRAAIWCRIQARQKKAALDALMNPTWLEFCEHPGLRFEALRFWSRLGDADFVRNALTTLQQQTELSAPALLAAADLIEAADEHASVPSSWFSLAAERARAADDLARHARALERLGAHPEIGDESCGALQAALDVYEGLDGAGASTTESVRHRLACLYEQQGDIPAAVALYEQALAGREQVLGGDDAGLVPWLANLGAAHKAAGSLKLANDAFRRALGLARKRLGSRHPTTAMCCDQMAGVAYLAGEYDDAERLYREAFEATEQAFGPRHAATAACLNNLGTVLDARQLYKEAEHCYRRALEIRTAAFGDNHTDTATTLHNLAATLEVSGQVTEAELLYRRALEAWDQLAGSEHAAFATTLNNLADLLREQRRWGDAEALYRADIEIWRKLVGPDHPHTLMALGSLGRLYVEGGKPDLAEPLLMHVAETTARSLGRADPSHLEAIAQLAALLRDTGRVDHARQQLQGALSAHADTIDIISPRIQKLRKMLDGLDQEILP
ncbi:MAG: tetratricopeptide repeat protein [Wenzhouxiangellaceae bacterium]|nr:tetratricopeptide repeat protein [Wenzhouxiangellaceae bacterium]